MKDGPYSRRRRDVDLAWTAVIFAAVIAMTLVAAAVQYGGMLKTNLAAAIEARQTNGEPQ